MAETMLLDADSHVSEPLNLWQERLPVKYRDIAPRMITEYEGQPGAWWCIEQDRHPHNVILGFGGNKTLEELQQLLKANGITDYSIFLDETTNSLFGVLNADDPKALDDLPSKPVMQKWWQYMSDIMETNPDNSPVSIPLKELFYLP